MTSTFAQVREYLEPLYDLVGNNEFTLKEIEDDLPQITKAVLTNLQNRRVILVNRRVGDIKIYEIQEFYRNCPEGYHVDHEIPLMGSNVCGLHVLDNLQYLTAEENMKKGNSFPF